MERAKQDVERFRYAQVKALRGCNGCTANAARWVILTSSASGSRDDVHALAAPLHPFRQSLYVWSHITQFMDGFGLSTVPSQSFRHAEWAISQRNVQNQPPSEPNNPPDREPGNPPAESWAITAPAATLGAGAALRRYRPAVG